jgi:hypothetical protein
MSWNRVSSTYPNLGLLLCYVSNKNLVLENIATTRESITQIRSKLDREEDMEILDWLTPSTMGTSRVIISTRGNWELDFGSLSRPSSEIG